VRGTFEVFEAAVSLGIDKIVFISTTRVYRPDSRYGSSKILAELIAEDYRKHRDINVITLRPRGFIPYWNRDVYANYSDGAGSTFKKYYPEYYDLALSYGLDPALKPTRLDISETVRWLGYKPAYGLANLLSELAVFGDSGPPHLPRAKEAHAPAG
jgi:hypothetical protein